MTNQTSSAEPAPDFLKRLLPIGLVGAQLALLFYTFHRFGLESQGYMLLAPLILGGFLVHALLPMRFRMPFFLALSLAGFGILWQWHAAVLVLVGLVLIGICHLPFRLPVRVGLLVLVGAGLAVLRAGFGALSQSPWVSTIMPVLGSIFMFRLMIYLYDLQHETKRASIWERLSYFFLLPNACFLLFPVIDYQTFRRTYYDTDEASIYQKGVFWIFRGMTHLLAYRILYHYVVPNPTQVVDLWSYVLIAVGTYMLYLRVSGLFHITVGTLGLFGFNLPETYHRFLLAAGFNDFWRRSNVYWKDFMAKIFYFPALMRLRKYGMPVAIGLATAGVFLATWLLHSYQWFWLLGAFPLTITDAIFWSTFGALVVINSLSQLKSGKKASLGRKSFSVRDAVVHGFKVIGMLFFISVIWSFWYSPSPGAWVDLIGQSLRSGPADFALLALIILGLIAIGVCVQFATSRGVKFTLLDPAMPSFNRAAIVTTTGALAILVLGLQPTKDALGRRADRFIASLQYEHLTEFDSQEADKGYYDALMTTNSIMVGLRQDTRNQRPAHWVPTRKSAIAEDTDDLLLYRLRPSVNAIIKDVPISINRWGMRDQDYELLKPAGAYRVALLGASIEMAEGIEAGETFEAVAEVQLNEELVGQPGAFQRYEILNFSVSGYSVIQHLAIMDNVVRFQPDLLVYTGHTVEDFRMLQLLVEIVQREIELPEHLAAIVQRAGVDPAMSESDAYRLLEPFAAEILREQYTRIVARCREAGIQPVWLFVPRVDQGRHVGRRRVPIDEVRELAREAGFFLLDIGDSFDGVEDVEGELFLAPWDNHPSAYGHQLLGRRFVEELLGNMTELGLSVDSSPAP